MFGVQACSQPRRAYDHSDDGTWPDHKKDIDKEKDKDNKKDLQRAIQETCDFWDIWSEWWWDMARPKKEIMTKTHTKTKNKFGPNWKPLGFAISTSSPTNHRKRKKFNIFHWCAPGLVMKTYKTPLKIMNSGGSFILVQKFCVFCIKKVILQHVFICVLTSGKCDAFLAVQTLSETALYLPM